MVPRILDDDELTPREAAALLGLPVPAVMRMAGQGFLSFGPGGLLSRREVLLCGRRRGTNGRNIGDPRPHDHLREPW